MDVKWLHCTKSNKWGCLVGVGKGVHQTWSNDISARTNGPCCDVEPIVTRVKRFREGTKWYLELLPFTFSHDSLAGTFSNAFVRRWFREQQRKQAPGCGEGLRGVRGCVCKVGASGDLGWSTHYTLSHVNHIDSQSNLGGACAADDCSIASQRAHSSHIWIAICAPCVCWPNSIRLGRSCDTIPPLSHVCEPPPILTYGLRWSYAPAETQTFQYATHQPIPSTFARPFALLRIIYSKTHLPPPKSPPPHLSPGRLSQAQQPTWDCV